jgi:hypothetical protein
LCTQFGLTGVISRRHYPPRTGDQSVRSSTQDLTRRETGGSFLHTSCTERLPLPCIDLHGRKRPPRSFVQSLEPVGAPLVGGVFPNAEPLPLFAL